MIEERVAFAARSFSVGVSGGEVWFSQIENWLFVAFIVPFVGFSTKIILL